MPPFLSRETPAQASLPPCHLFGFTIAESLPPVRGRPVQCSYGPADEEQNALRLLSLWRHSPQAASDISSHNIRPLRGQFPDRPDPARGYLFWNYPHDSAVSSAAGCPPATHGETRRHPAPEYQAAHIQSRTASPGTRPRPRAPACSTGVRRWRLRSGLPEGCPLLRKAAPVLLHPGIAVHRKECRCCIGIHIPGLRAEIPPQIHLYER